MLASQVRVTDLRGGQLELTVPSGTLATAVRQRSPELLIALASHFHEFNRIRVRVQPLTAPVSPQAVRSRRPPPVAAPLQSLARSLPDGPLRNAILRLIKAK
ncbi:MAG: DUF721 domain-containing protein [Gallionellaceae bacterium]|nr:DUF721 domain-containing protein [Gallionellaceae bacterium]